MIVKPFNMVKQLKIISERKSKKILTVLADLFFWGIHVILKYKEEKGFCWSLDITNEFPTLETFLSQFVKKKQKTFFFLYIVLKVEGVYIKLEPVFVKHYAPNIMTDP